MGSDVTMHELTDPVAQTEYLGRQLAITVQGTMYGCWVDGEYYYGRAPQTGSAGAVDLLDADNIAIMARVLRSWIDDEQQLRQLFPLGTTVRSIPHKNRHGVRSLAGIVVGHKHWVVSVKITDTNYTTGEKAQVGAQVPLRGDQLQVPRSTAVHHRKDPTHARP